MVKESRQVEYMPVGNAQTSEQMLRHKIRAAKRIIAELYRPLKRQADFAAALDRRFRGQSEAEKVLSELNHLLKEWL